MGVDQNCLADRVQQLSGCEGKRALECSWAELGR